MMIIRDGKIYEPACYKRYCRYYYTDLSKKCDDCLENRDPKTENPINHFERK